ncbi:MAG TPA: hypothetical protein DDZ55_04050 [Firmicutes bacterium]|nr:hypothetical protein [Bacillota bacterium]
MENKKSVYSLLNATSAVGLTLVNGLLGIIVTRFIIVKFGSDFNGLNSTANQIMNVLLVLEGGFTLASNVALFAPLGRKDTLVVNGVLAATQKKFKQIGCLFLGIGIIVTVGYTYVIHSGLSKEFIVTLLLMTIVPQAFNLFYATKYRVLLQAQQKEFIINFITMLTVGLGHLANIILILCIGEMWMVRFITMLFAFLNSFLIAWYVKRKNSFINFKVEPRTELISGTGDVMVQKITGVIYNSAPIVFLSISPVGGTLLASVYAVYNNVFTMIKSLLHGVIDAPRLSIGQILTERSREEVWYVFRQYEYVAFLAIFAFLTTTCTLILPFVSIYTYGIKDVNYYNKTIALLLVFISSIEMLHIPSGHLINMAGEFKVSRNFQMIACVLLMATMIYGGVLWGLNGMLTALLVTAIALAFMEMGYIHAVFFRGKVYEMLKLIFPLIIFGVLLCCMERRLSVSIEGYVMFFIWGIILLCINSVISLLIALIFNRSIALELLSRACSLVKKN